MDNPSLRYPEQGVGIGKEMETIEAVVRRILD
jgi:hypothetical protein